jgi:hypothetical protein
VEDHLAGAKFAIELLEAIRDQHTDDSLGLFAAELLVEIKKDNTTLQDLAHRIGARSSSLKWLSAWVAEKVTRLKLHPGSSQDLGVFEALEFLTIGIHGKLQLWRALALIATQDTRLTNVNFDQLAARAEVQHGQVEEHRLATARLAFLAVTK